MAKLQVVLQGKVTSSFTGFSTALRNNAAVSQGLLVKQASLVTSEHYLIIIIFILAYRSDLLGRLAA